MIWLAAELPPDMPPACIVQAAQYYKVPEIVLVTVLRKERGKLGRTYERSHGIYYGPYQVSDKWLERFTPWGLTPERITHDACSNAIAGAYVLAYYKAREPSWFRAIARYNVGSLDTPTRREAGFRYAQAVLADWRQIHKRHSTAKPPARTAGLQTNHQPARS